MNERLTEQNEFLKQQLRREQFLNDQLRNYRPTVPVVDDSLEFKPIGGFTTLRQRIKKAENESRQRAAELANANEE